MCLELLSHGCPHKDILNQRIVLDRSYHLLCNEEQICQGGGEVMLF